MDILEMVKSQLSSSVVNQLASQVGLDPQTANGLISSLLPTLVGGIANNATSNPNAASSLLSALDRDHDGSVLDDVMGFLGGGNAEGGGMKILNHILGGNTANVANGIGQSAGVESNQVMSMMASLAPLVMGALGKAKNEQGLDASGLMSMLGGQAQNIQNSGFGSILTGLLDKNKDGNMVDDVMGMLGNFMKK